MITEELVLGGFSVESLWGDLTGKQYSPDSEWIGIVASKNKSIPSFIVFTNCHTPSL